MSLNCLPTVNMSVLVYYFNVESYLTEFCLITYFFSYSALQGIMVNYSVNNRNATATHLPQLHIYLFITLTHQVFTLTYNINIVHTIKGQHINCLLTGMLLLVCHFNIELYLTEFCLNTYSNGYSAIQGIMLKFFLKNQNTTDTHLLYILITLMHQQSTPTYNTNIHVQTTKGQRTQTIQTQISVPGYLLLKFIEIYTNLILTYRQLTLIING